MITNPNYKLITLFEVYAIDGGGQGTYINNIAYFTSFEPAENCRREEGGYASMQAIPAIQVGEEIFKLEGRQSYWGQKPFQPSFTINPLKVDTYHSNQKELDQKRTNELLSSLSEKDKELLKKAL